MLAARIDRLPEKEKRVLQTASVIGKTFSEPVLKRVGELPETELAEALRGLIEAEFLYEEALYPEAEYAFKHPLTQEIAYGSQLLEHKARVHAAVARTIEERDAEKLDERSALLAYHWEHAGEAVEAIKWHRQAAEWAGMKHSAEALKHWRSVQRLLDRFPETNETLTQRAAPRAQMLGPAMRSGASREELAALFSEGRDLALRSRNDQVLSLLLSSYGFFKVLSGPIEDGLALIVEAVERADRTDDAGLRAVVRYSLTQGRFAAGHFRQSLSAADEGLALTGGDLTVGARWIGASPYLILMGVRGATLSYLGRPGEAGTELDRAIALAQTNGQEGLLGFLHQLRVVACELSGDTPSALAHGRKAVKFGESTGNRLQWNSARAYHAIGCVVHGDWQDALVAAELALEISRELGLTGWNEVSYVTMARAYLGLGDAAAARTAAEEAISVMRRFGRRLYHCQAQIVLAQALLSAEGLGARDRAALALSEALTFAEESGAKGLEPFVHEALAEVARVSGDDAALRRELREAKRLFAEMGATGHVDRLAKELGL